MNKKISPATNTQVIKRSPSRKSDSRTPLWRQPLTFYLVFGLFLLGLPLLAGASTTINHQFTGATINPGDVSKYRITLTNDDTGSTLTNARVTVLLKPQITVTAPLVITNTCGFTVNQPTVPGGSTIELVNGTINAGVLGDPSQCYFEVEVTATAPGNWINTIPANLISFPPPQGTPTIVPNATTSGYLATTTATGVLVANATDANTTLSVNTLSPPTGSKSFNPSPARVGNPVTLTITLNNPNANTTIPLTPFTDTLPDDLAGHAMLVNGTPSVSCTGVGKVDGSVAAAPGNKSVTLTGATIGNGGTCTLIVPVAVPSINGTAQVFDNILGQGAIGNTRGLISAPFNQTLTVNTPIAISKSFATSPIPAGQPSEMILTVTNYSSLNSLDIGTFSDNLTGTSLQVLTTLSTPVAAAADPSVICTGTGASNGNLTYIADTLDTTLSLANATAGPGGACTIRAYVTSYVDGAHLNTTSKVTNPANNYDSTPASASLTAIAQLQVSKSVSVSQVAPGQWTEFTVTIRNYTGVRVDNVLFKDLLPKNGSNQMVVFDPPGSPSLFDTSGCNGGIWTGLDVAGISTGSEPVSGVDAGLQWSGGNIDGGFGASPGVCVIRFRAKLPDSATTGLTFTNQIPLNGVNGTRSDNGSAVSNPDTNPAVNVVSVDAVAVTKSFNPTFIPQGGTSTLAVTIYNRITESVTNIDLTDNLPAGLTLAANPAATSTCGGALQAFPGDTKVMLTGGTLNPRPDASQETTCTITVRVTGTAVGTYNNTISGATYGPGPKPISNSNTATLDISTGLSGTKTFNPTSVTSGGTARVTITATNAFNGQLTNISIDDNTFSAGLTVANPANAATSCSGSPILVVNPGTTRAQLLGAVLNAGASCTFSFDVDTSGTGPWPNTIPAGKITSAEGPSNTAAISANLGVNSASLGINKSFNPVLVTGGVPSVLTIDVINNSSITIHDAGFTDTFPPGIVVYSVPTASTSCAGGTVTAIPGDGRVVLEGATLAPNANCQVFVTTTSVKFLNLTNTIPALSVSTAEGYTNPLATAATLSTLQGLGVMKGFAPAYIPVDGTSRLKITLVSTFDPNAVSPTIMTGVSFTDTLPTTPSPGLSFKSAPSTTCSNGSGGFANVTVGSGALTLSGATIPPGSTCVVEVDVTATSTGAYDNTIPPYAVSTVQGVTNQTAAAARLNVVTQPTIGKHFSAASVEIGQATRLTITVGNGSGVNLSGIALTDLLPAGLVIAASPNAGTTCNNGVVTALAGSQEVNLTGAMLNNGLSCTFYADIVSNTAGAYPNHIGVGKLVTDQGLTNTGIADATLTVLPPASVVKHFSPVSILADGTSTLTITLQNTSGNAITLTSDLVDALPGKVVVATPLTLGGTCPGVKTATAGGTTVTYASGGTIPAGSCTITVTVTSHDAGSYVNVIAAGQLQTSVGNNQDPTIATLGVGQPAPPTVSKSFNPGTIAINGTSTLTITMGNPNTSALTLSAPFTDNLPANVSVAGTPNIGGTCPGSITTGAASVTYAKDALIPAGGCTITVDVTSGFQGSYTNTIPVNSLQTDGGGNPQAAIDGLVVQAPVPPTAIKSFSPNVINPGGISRLILSLGNANSNAINLNSDFTDNLPANVLVAAAPNIGGTCPGSITTGAGSITYANGATIPSGGCTILVDVTSIASGGPYTNLIAAGDLRTNIGNNTGPATADLFVNPPQPPSVSKSFSPTIIPKNGTSTLSISLGNGNASPLTLSSRFDDLLPANLVVADSNVPAGNCSQGSVTAAAGSGTISYAAGATIPPGGCTIPVRVTSATPGTYTNTIPAGALQTAAGPNAVGTSAQLQVLDWPTNSDLSLIKTIAPGTGVAGDTQTVTLKWRNTNAANPTRRMYQCVISDPLPTSAFEETSAAAVTTPAGYTFSRSGNTVTYTRTDTTTPCETTEQTAIFTVNLKSAVITGSTYINTATATAKTLPSDDPNAANAVTLTKNASANVTVTAPTASGKTLVATSQDFTDHLDTNKDANPPVAIGERVTYSIPFNVPPGVTSAVTLADEITTGIGDMTLVSATLARSSTNLLAQRNPASINFAGIGVPVDVTGQTVVSGNEFQVALDDVTNSDSAVAVYTLTVTLRVSNVVANTPPHTITDRGRLRYRNASGTPLSVTTSSTKSVHIAVPKPKVQKGVSPAAPAGGDTVTYTLTITNDTTGANAAAGFDWTFKDVLPVDLSSPGAFSVISNPNLRAIAGSFTGNTLDGTIDRLDPGESVTMTYQASVPVGTPFGKTIVNSATVRATTIPAGDPDESGERTGDGTGANNLAATTTVSLTTKKPTITKDLVNPPPNNYYAIGDLVSYRITISVPEGTTGNFTVTDALPAGLSFVAGSAQLSTSGGVTTPAAGSITPSSTSPLTFPLGTITATASGSISIDFTVQVANDRTNQNNVSLTNIANATYDNPNGGAPLTLSATAEAMKVGEPNLTMTKTIISGATGSVAASVVRWEFTVTNSGTTTAYQETISDQLPDHLNNISIVSVTTSGGNIQNNNPGCSTGTAVSPSNAAVTPTVNPNDTLTIAGICIAAGATLTVQYDSTVMNTAVAGEQLTNTVRATYASQPAGASSGAVVRDGLDPGTDDDSDPASGTCNGTTVKCNNYNESASAPLTIDAPIAIDKQADKTSATIGETVTYTIKISVIEGVTPNVVVTDELPIGLTYVSREITLGHIGMTAGNPVREGSGQTVRFSLGDIGNNANGNKADDYFTLAITARVDNRLSNQKGTILRNGEGSGSGQNTPTVKVQFGSTPTTVGYDYDGISGNGYQGRPLTITEPALKVTKTATPTTQALGDEVLFTLLVQHDGANSDATAYDLVLTDTLPAGFTYVNGSATPINPSVSGQVLTFQSASLTTAASTLTITYRAKIDLTAIVGATLTNQAALTWKSQSGATGDADSGRTGDSPGGLNDYRATASANVSVNESAAISALKTVTDLNGGTLLPNETLEYTIVLTKNSGSVTNVVFTDTVPPNTTYLGNLTTSKGTATFSGNTVTVAVGAMDSETVTVKFRVTVNSGVAAGTVISNQGRVDSDQTVPTPTDADGIPGNGYQPTTIEVTGPPALHNALYVEKIVSWITDTDSSGSITPGDRMRYTLIFHNLGQQTLTNVGLTDSIPANLAYVSSSASASSGTISVNAPAVTVSGLTLPVSGMATAQFDVTVGAAGTFTNQGTATSDQTGSVKTDSNGDPTDGNQPTVFIAVASGGGTPVIDVQKRWQLVVDLNGDGRVNPGDTLGYTITLRNTGSAGATNVRLADSIPANATVVAGSALTSQGVIISESPLSVNLGTLNPGGLVTVSFAVTVDSATPACTIIPNQAVVTGGNFSPVVSDDNASVVDGLNPTLTPVACSSVGLSKVLWATSEAGSANSNLMIGEVAAYRITMDIPAGTTREMTMTDTLPAGMTYRPASARLMRSFDTGLVASANPGNINGALSGTFVALTDGTEVTVSGQTIALFLGDVINSDSDGNAESYTLELKAIVLNTVGNQAGTTLTNQAGLSYLNGLLQPQNLTPVSHTSTVIEPRIQITKAAAPLAILPSGGTVNYTVTITNPAGASVGTAYEVRVTDSLPAVFGSLSAISTTPSGGVAGVTNNSVGTTLDIRAAEFPPDGRLIITYQGTTAGPLTDGSTINNTAAVAWTSLPGDRGTGNAAPGASGTATGERTGADGPGGLNDYTSTASALVRVGPVGLAKVVLNPQARYAVGDIVTYRLTIGFARDLTVDNVLLQDVLAEGLTYQSGTLIVAKDPGISASLSPGEFTRTDNSPAPGQEKLELNFGTVIVTGAGAGNLTLTYQARLDNSISNQNNQNLLNQATLGFTDPGTGLPVSLNAGSSVTVGEPHLTLGKTITSAMAGLDAGDTVSFQVVVGNDGTTTAYDTVLTDLLPVGLENITHVNVLAAGGAGLPSVTNPGGQWQTSAFTLPVGGTVTITFDTRISTTVLPGQQIQNRVGAVFTSRNGADPNERNGSSPGSNQDDGQLNNYNLAANAPIITVRDPVAIDKQFYPLGTKTTFAIGEPVTYRLRVSLIEGTVNNLVVTDTLPAGVTYTGSLVGVGSTNLTYSGLPTPVQVGQVLTFTLGQVTNLPDGIGANDFITIDVSARVDNVAENQDRTLLGNQVRIQCLDSLGALVTRDFDADANTPGIQPLYLTIVEPSLLLRKTASPTSVSLGDETTFTIVVAHSAFNRATAYDIVVTDTLPTGLVYVDGSGMPTPLLNGQTLTFTIDALTLTADQTAISFRAKVNPAAAAGIPLTNRAVATYTSLPGASLYERTGSGGLNDYIAVTTAEIIPSTASSIEAVKTVTDLNGGLVMPGDTLEYNVTLTNTGSSGLAQVRFTDPLPAWTAFAGSLTTTKGSGSLTGGLITVNVGSLAPAETVTILFQVTVNGDTPSGTVISNQGSVDSAQTVPQPTDGDGNPNNGYQPTDVVVGGVSPQEPRLYAEKTAALLIDTDGNGSISVGDTVRYTVFLRNVGKKSLTNVTFSDPIPANLSYVGGSATVTPGGVIGESGAILSATITTLAAGELAVVRFDATIEQPGTFTNQGTAVSDQTGPVLTDSDGAPENGSQPTQFNAVAANGKGSPSLVLDKLAILTEDFNGDALVNPGETISYVITIQNIGSSAAGDVRLSDPLPALTTMSPGSVTSTHGAVLSENPVTVNIGPINPGEVVTVRFRTHIAANAPNGASVLNTATVSQAGSGPLQAQQTTIILSSPAVVGSLCGSVFKDCDQDGARDPLERGLSGVTVHLFRGNGTWIATATTNFLGVYRFNDVPEGTYKVQEVIPSGYLSSTPKEVSVSILEGETSTASFGLQTLNSPCQRKIYLPIIVN